MLIAKRWVHEVRWACVFMMHLKRRPRQLLKLLAGNSATLALMVVQVKTFLPFPPPRGTCVVGVVGHGGAPLGERLAKHTTDRAGASMKKEHRSAPLSKHHLAPLCRTTPDRSRPCHAKPQRKAYCQPPVKNNTPESLRLRLLAFKALSGKHGQCPFPSWQFG